MTIAKPKTPLSTEEYERLGSLGLLPTSGVELIDGKIVAMSPKGDRHSYVVSELSDIFSTHPNRNYRVYSESLSLQALPQNTPDPDIALARLVRSYVSRRPQPSEIALIVEVADSSFGYDMDAKSGKLAIYAKANIVEYWVVDIRQNCDAIYCFSDPRDGAYTTSRRATVGDTLAPLTFPLVSVDLDRIFLADEDVNA